MVKTRIDFRFSGISHHLIDPRINALLWIEVCVYLFQTSHRFTLQMVP